MDRDFIQQDETLTRAFVAPVNESETEQQDEKTDEKFAELYGFRSGEKYPHFWCGPNGFSPRGIFGIREIISFDFEGWTSGVSGKDGGFETVAAAWEME